MPQSLDIEGFSHNTSIPAASRVGPLLATSIIIGRNDGTRDLPSSIEAQLANLFRYGKRILDAAGGQWSDVVKFDFWVTDRAHRAAVEEAWLGVYTDPGHMPARHTQVADLAAGVLVQMTFLAYVTEPTAPSATENRAS